MAAINDLSESIASRVSCRTFDEATPLDDTTQQELQQRLKKLAPGPLGHEVKVHLLTQLKLDELGIKKLGTYGFISGAKNFLAGVVVAGEKAMVDYGFVFEQAVLAATELGLATCWLGGTYHRSGFEKVLEIAPGHCVPAVSPVGYRAMRQGAIARTIRAVAGSANRKAWKELFFAENWDKALQPETLDEAFANALEDVRQAPSASNRQPWRVVHDAGRFHFFLKRTVGQRILTTHDLQCIDLGIAMAHFELSLRAAGLDGCWVEEDPKLSGKSQYLLTWRPRELTSKD